MTHESCAAPVRNSRVVGVRARVFTREDAMAKQVIDDCTIIGDLNLRPVGFDRRKNLF